MLNYHPHTRPFATLAFALMIGTSLATTTLAANCFEQTGCRQCCPACDHCCTLEAKMGETEKKCFEVESKVICIPRVVFPWQRSAMQGCFHRSCDTCDGDGCSNCVHNGAKTRKVKILSSRKYKCPKCEYTWTAEERPSTPCGGVCDAKPTHFAPPVVPEDVQPWNQALIESPDSVESIQPSYTDPTSSGLESIQIEK